jgi:acyl dehydratase
MPTKLYYEDVEVGTEVPSFLRKTDLMSWNRFAAANDEHVYFHMDHNAGKAMGMDGAFGMGNLRFAYLHNMLFDWIGEEGDIRKVGCQYRGLNMENDTLTAWGKVINKMVKDGEHLVELEIGVKNQSGQETAPGHAVVTLPSKGE